MGEKPVTGNIYKETFIDQGQRYVNYYVDCAECGNEISVYGLGRGETVTNKIKHDGWRKKGPWKKWVCLTCLSDEREATETGAEG